eukprot:m.8280 g.8280  ORF g.8280 m.8280 type:complete len:288 (-) comp2271_c0_seq1:249-1112(-)
MLKVQANTTIDLGRLARKLKLIGGYVAGGSIASLLGWHNPAMSALSLVLLLACTFYPNGIVALLTLLVLVVLTRGAFWSDRVLGGTTSREDVAECVAVCDGIVNELAFALEYINCVTSWDDPWLSLRSFGLVMGMLLAAWWIPLQYTMPAAVLALYLVGLLGRMRPEMAPSTVVSLLPPAPAAADSAADADPATPQLTPSPSSAGLAPRLENCNACSEPFSLAKWRHYCRMCGLAFCRSCCHLKVPATLPTPGASDFTARDMVSVCERCFRSRNASAQALAAGDHHA